MEYINQICDGCGRELTKDDDIVVCPVCGTPQHRECYNKNDRCVHEELHESGYVWKAPEKPEPEKKQEVPQGNTVPFFQMTGKDEEVRNVFLAGTGISPDEDVDGVKASEAALYIQQGAGRYLKKFLKTNGKKFALSWNWAAFFFNPHWFFYRKMYKAGFIFLGVIIALNVAFVSQADKIEDYYEYLNTARQELVELTDNAEDAESAENQAGIIALSREVESKTREVMPTFVVYLLVVSVIPSVVAALIANSLYKRKMLMDIDEAHSLADDPRQASIGIIRRGGVSIIAPVGSLVIVTYLPNILLNIASKINL
ncbi:MAG: DUF2628 domain-containing protein [Clostridia bacterium]|nr:DUF2628 domain-containing protein [Clostridia bacterium]